MEQQDKSAIALLTEAFKGQGRKKITVNLGDLGRLDVYVEPMNAEMRKVLLTKVNRCAFGIDQAVATVIELALNDLGEKLFDPIADKPLLKRNVNPDIVAGLARELLNAHYVEIGAAESVEAAGKSSSETQG